MTCPVDGGTLVMAERHSVEIDYCPECRGVWLDRGELDRIVENAAPKASPAPRRYDDDGDRRDERRRMTRKPFHGVELLHGFLPLVNRGRPARAGASVAAVGRCSGGRCDAGPQALFTRGRAPV